MGKLRWTLLILGGLFLIGLALWERLRPRQARRLPRDQQAIEPPAPSGALALEASDGGAMHGFARAGGVNRPQRGGEHGEGRAAAQDREAGMERAARVIPASSRTTAPRNAGPSVHEAGIAGWNEPGMGRLSGEQRASEVVLGKLPQTDVDAAGTGPLEPWIGEQGLAEAVPADGALPEVVVWPGPPRGTDWLHDNPDSSMAPLADPPVVLLDEARQTDRPGERTDESPAAEVPVLSRPAVDVPAGPPRRTEEFGVADAAAAPGVMAAAAPGRAPAMAPIVEWPSEDSRHIVALRLVAGAERFPGRALRQALAAEGFLPGKFEIFHRPDETRRAVVSAASLTRPGTFDPETMDSQRYAGLNLFTVLPGPRPDQQAFDELVEVAQNLAERLQGELQDARGEALTAETLQAMRAALPTSAGPGAAS